MRKSFWDVVGKQANLKTEMQYLETMFCGKIFYC